MTNTTVERGSTATFPRPDVAGHGPNENSYRPRGRTAIGITLIVALLLSATLQHTAYSYRQAAINQNRPQGVAAPSRLANLDSFSLALLLGGLRGPLVMFLWTNSESQKSEKDLESFDTQVELIRLLQGEFDSVHIFQMWNKAYNVSVQMASLSNKYAAILDALDYGQKIDRSNPNNVNILTSIGGLYSDKLGASSEKDYYRPRVRTESLPVYRITIPAAQVDAFKKAITDAGVDPARVRLTSDAAGAATTTATVEKVAGDHVLTAYKGPPLAVKAVARQALRPPDSRGRRVEMDTMLDEKGYILPQYLTPTRAGVPPDSDENDGSELQYLKRFEPFPYGLSPIALGYNYFKRGQYLYRVGKQKHLQLSDLVLDNQPGLNLKAWAEEEWDRGRRLEQRAFGVTGEAVEKLSREMRTASLAPDARVVDRAALDEAIFSYRRASQVARAALPELAAHVKNFPSNLQNYSSHTQNLLALSHLTAADARFLQATLATTPEQRRAMLVEAQGEYAEAAKQYMILTLKYWVDQFDAREAGYARAEIQDKPQAEIEKLYVSTINLLQKKYGRNTPNLNDVQEYGDNIARIMKRRATLK